MDQVPSRFRPAAEWLAAFCRETPGVAAAYLGGSLATGRVDADSDLDATIVTLPGAREEVFNLLLDRLGEEWQLHSRWVLPTPTWHGGLQTFDRVTPREGEAEPLILDLVVDEVRAAWVEVDPVRHGHVVVLHDPERLVSEKEEDPDSLGKAAAAAVDQIEARLEVAEWLILKAVRRGHWPEAHAYHLRLGVAAVVDLLRVRHCPQRWDFGLRYLDADLPGELADRVVGLLPEGNDSLAAKAEEAFAWQRELLAELRGGAGGFETGSASASPSSTTDPAR